MHHSNIYVSTQQFHKKIDHLKSIKHFTVRVLIKRQCYNDRLILFFFPPLWVGELGSGTSELPGLASDWSIKLSPEASECFLLSMTGVPARELGADKPGKGTHRNLQWSIHVNFISILLQKKKRRQKWLFSSLWLSKGSVPTVIKIAKTKLTKFLELELLIVNKNICWTGKWNDLAH